MNPRVVVLECGPSPFLSGWRRYAYFSRGRQIGVAMGCESGAGARVAALGFRFFPAGTWEASGAVGVEAGTLAIKTDVLNLIHGTPQGEFVT